MVILDDVMSELDSERQEYILNKISGGQVFITCCDPKQIAGLKVGKAFLPKTGGFRTGNIAGKQQNKMNVKVENVRRLNRYIVIGERAMLCRDIIGISDLDKTTVKRTRGSF